MSKIVYLGHTDSPDQTIEFGIGATRYIYLLPSHQMLDTILFILRKASVGKAFAQAKRKGKLLEPVQ